MELLQLRYFCVVAKHQNMTKAAAELMISQPALSKTIASLEKELGTPLFVRRNRSIFLNRAGEILYQKIDQKSGNCPMNPLAMSGSWSCPLPLICRAFTLPSTSAIPSSSSS